MGTTARIDGKWRHFQARGYPGFGRKKNRVFFSNREFWKKNKF